MLLESPSDYEDCHYYLDINCSDFCQTDCYIGAYKIENIIFSRLKEADCKCNSIAEWNVEIIVIGKKCEKEIYDILNELCQILSLRYLRFYKHIHNCGFEGFSYDRMRLEIMYAFEDRIFNNNAFVMSGCRIEMSSKFLLNNKVFKLPKREITKSKFADTLITAYIKALKSKDKISRYILLYYLFELMYGTEEYQKIKKQYEETAKDSYTKSNKNNKNYGDKKRSELLFRYFQQEFNLTEYTSLGKKIILEETILENIITTRNDLTHRGDLTKISELMYNHLVPILQEIINKCSKDL